MTPKKFLTKVTVTGADDGTTIDDLFELQERFPYAEFGILLSERHSTGNGTARFPSSKWLKDLCVEHWNSPQKLNLSGHVCGKWVREALVGNWPNIGDAAPIPPLFNRYQLNTHAQSHDFNKYKFSTFLSCLENAGGDPTPTIIFQLDGKDGSMAASLMADEKHGNIAGLFDLSHGAGVLPEQWPKADELAMSCGYAGGLSLTNVAQQLEQIQEVAGEGAWIDAETHLRNRRDQFDVGLCAEFLEKARPWVV